MKNIFTKLCFLIPVFFYCAFANAQYFKNSVYYKYYNPFESGYNYYDSLTFDKTDGTGSYYRLFRNKHETTFLGKSMTIKLADSSLYVKLDHNQDSSYHLIFNLRAKVGDTVKAQGAADWFSYVLGNSNITFTTIPMKVQEIKDSNFNGHIRKVWILTNQYTFVDSIGFGTTGFFAHWYGQGFSQLYYVCSGGKVIYTEHSQYLNGNYCSSDSFYRKLGHGDGIIRLAARNHLVKLYPNPATSQLTIESSELSPEIAITIFNNLGQAIEVPQTIIDANHIVLDTHQLSKGVYTILAGSNRSGIFTIE